MTPQGAKKAVLILMATTGVVAIVRAAQAGEKPKFSIGVGVFGSTVLLTALAEVDAQMAVGLAGLTTFGAAAVKPETLAGLATALKVRRSTSSKKTPTGWLAAFSAASPNSAPNTILTGGAAGATGATSSTGPNTAANPPTLVLIGQGSHRLAPAAAAAFRQAEQIYGSKILVTDSYRSYADQARAYASDSKRFGSPQTSYHVKGQAVDVIKMQDAQLAAAMAAAGWVRYAPDVEPWHWSFGGRG